jgi:Cas7 group CRISPR-associated protein Csh2
MLDYNPKRFIDVFGYLELINGNINGNPDSDGAPRINNDMEGFATGQSIKRRMKDLGKKMLEHDLFTIPGTNIKEKLEALGIKAKEKKGKKKETPEEFEKALRKLCQDYFEFRIFGFVTCGQKNIKGAWQIPTFDTLCPIEVIENTLSVCFAREKEESNTQTFGRKAMIHHAVFSPQMFYMPYNGEDNGITKKDIEDFMELVKGAYNYCLSDALGLVRWRHIYVNQHVKDYRRCTNDIELEEFFRPTLLNKGLPSKSINDYKFRAEEEIKEFQEKMKNKVEISDLVNEY